MCVTGHSRNFAKMHADALQEGADLGWRAPNTCQLFNLGLRLGHGARRMGAEMRLQAGLMRVKRTGLPSKVKALQSFDTVLLIQMQDRHDRLTRQAAQARNLLVGHGLTFEVHHFHALLYVGRRMSIAFILQGSNLSIRKSDLYHHVLIGKNGVTINMSISNQE